MLRLIGPGGWPSRLRVLLGRSLMIKIMAALAVLVLPLSGGFWYQSMQSEKRHLTASAADFAAVYAELVRNSVREEMLRNDRDRIQRTVSSITGLRAVRSLRIYNRRGVVVFSSNPADIGHRALSDEQSCLGCHDDPLRPHETLHEQGRHTVFADPGGHRILSYVEPIYNEPVCATAACHAHGDGGRVLGILLADFPLTRVDQQVQRQIRDFTLFVVLYVLALGTLGYLVLWRIVLRPVRALAAGVERVAAGDLTRTVSVDSGDEIGRLAGNFNAMTMELDAVRRHMERQAQGLERQVAAKTAEVRQAAGRLAESEKLAALGRLTAEIAHEIRNPLTALGGYGRRLLRTVSSEKEKEYARIVVNEAIRLESLLHDVLDYSSPPRYHLVRHSLTGIVRESLAAFGELCAEHGITVEAAFAAEQSVFVDFSHVRRAVDNLILNAVDAMPSGGTLRVATRLAAARHLTFVVITFEDTGPGISAEHLARIYEPFWTTKRIGHGTGLGLSITRNIIEAHRGFIHMASCPGGGLMASLWFPFQSDEDLARPPCWEVIRCGRTGSDVAEPCPAWPDFGRACWAVAGTLCEGVAKGTQARNIGDCSYCNFFRTMVPRDGR